MKVRVISVSEKQKWNEIVTRAFVYDFYHCNSYNSLDRLGEPFLFVAEEDEDFIAIPLIRRKIKETSYYDCTSVWGYPGPIASKHPSSLSADFIAFFQREIRQYMVKNKIVAAFSRLHPIIPQQPLLEDIGAVTTMNKTVAIDLSLPPEEQRRQYQKSTKWRINKLRSRGYSVKRADTPDELSAFYAIYIETMERLNADVFYFDCFPLDYFQKLLSLDDARSNLLIAYRDGEVVAGSFFIATEKFMQYHVAGTKTEHMKDTPMKLIVDEARLMANEMNLDYLHLGGGVNGTDEDSLFQFKAGFSDQTFRYKVWKYIADEDMYNHLVQNKAKEKQLNSAFFPLYRG